MVRPARRKFTHAYGYDFKGSCNDEILAAGAHTESKRQNELFRASPCPRLRFTEQCDNVPVFEFSEWDGEPEA